MSQNYMKEACGLRAALYVNRTCDVNVEADKLHIPIVPCNFVPIQPHDYTGNNIYKYKTSVYKTRRMSMEGQGGLAPPPPPSS